MRIDETIDTPFQNGSFFFTCSDHVQQLSENNFQMKIAEVSQIIEEKKSSLLLV